MEYSTFALWCGSVSDQSLKAFFAIFTALFTSLTEAWLKLAMTSPLEGFSDLKSFLGLVKLPPMKWPKEELC